MCKCQPNTFTTEILPCVSHVRVELGGSLFEGFVRPKVRGGDVSGGVVVFQFTISEPMLGDLVRGDQDLDPHMECNMESIECARRLMVMGLHGMKFTGVQMKSDECS